MATLQLRPALSGTKGSEQARLPLAEQNPSGSQNLKGLVEYIRTAGSPSPDFRERGTGDEGLIVSKRKDTEDIAFL
jgi:hypothetical protein